MSGTAQQVPTQRDPFNWTKALVVLGFLIFAALAFIGLMLYQNNRAINDTTPANNSTFNYDTSMSGEKSQAMACEEELNSLWSDEDRALIWNNNKCTTEQATTYLVKRNGGSPGPYLYTP